MSIRELKQVAGSAPQPCCIHVQVESVQVKPTRQGTEFAEMKLADSRDGFTLRVWGDSPQFSTVLRLQVPAFVELKGDWTASQYGLESKNWTLRTLTEEETQELLAGSPALREKQETDFCTIEALTASIADPRLHGVCRLFLEIHGDRFRRAAAAREYHHARRGGLVEHVAQMMRSAAALCTVYTSVNRDLLLAAVLFHDCGKLWENGYSPTGFAMPYSEHGEMLGHITMGIELVNKLWRGLMDSGETAGWLALTPASEEVRLHLLHLIASHHGEYQFGSPVLPKTPEAILLHHVDNMDAKLEMMFSAYETGRRLAKNIVERQRPLPANLVQPLAVFDGAGPRRAATEA